MELDDLLEREGLDAQSVEQTLEWARDRAQQLVADVGADPELGPLLDDAAPVPSTPVQVAPPAPVETVNQAPAAAEPEGAEEAPVEAEPAEAAVPELIASEDASEEGDLFESSELQVPLDAGLDSPVQAEAHAQAEDEDEAAAAETDEAAAESEESEEAEAPAEPDPLADMDFDNLPGADEGEPEFTGPSDENEPSIAETLEEPSQIPVNAELTERLSGEAAPDPIEAMVTAPAEVPIPAEQTAAEDEGADQPDDEEEDRLVDLELLEEDVAIGPAGPSPLLLSPPLLTLSTL